MPRGGLREGSGAPLKDPRGEKREPKTYHATPTEHEQLRAFLERYREAAKEAKQNEDAGST